MKKNIQNDCSGDEMMLKILISGIHKNKHFYLDSSNVTTDSIEMFASLYSNLYKIADQFVLLKSDYIMAKMLYSASVDALLQVVPLTVKYEYKEYYNHYPILAALVSDNPGIIKDVSDYNLKPYSDIPLQYAQLVFKLCQKAVQKDFDVGFETIIDELIPWEKRLKKYCVTISPYFMSLAENDSEKCKISIEYLAGTISKRSNASIGLEHYNLEITGLTKLAHWCGLYVEIDHPSINSELLKFCKLDYYHDYKESINLLEPYYEPFDWEIRAGLKPVHIK